MTAPTSDSADNFLYVGGDPTGWKLVDPEPAPPPWRDSEEPVALAVGWPLPGRLVLAPRRAGSVAFLAAQSSHPWIPCLLLLPHIYVPTPAGADRSQPGYSLDAGTDLPALEESIKDAMRHGTPLDLTVSGLNGSGVLVLNGAALPFVVLCPPNA